MSYMAQFEQMPMPIDLKLEVIDSEMDVIDFEIGVTKQQGPGAKAGESRGSGPPPAGRGARAQHSD